MAEPAYPSLEKEGQAGPIGFEGVAAQDDQDGSFSVQFTPSAGADKQQLTDEEQPSYRTFDGEQPAQASSEEINLLDREKQSSPSEKERVKAADGVCSVMPVHVHRLVQCQYMCLWQISSVCLHMYGAYRSIYIVGLLLG